MSEQKSMGQATSMPTLIPSAVVLFLHGLESSPEGYKANAMREAGMPVIAPDHRGMTLNERIRQTRWVLATHRSSLLVGSSYGGLAATYLAQTQPERFFGLVLAAPALIRSEPPIDDPSTLVIPPSLPTIILHGTRDALIPIDVSRQLVARSGDHVTLWELDDEHQLRSSIDRVLEAVRTLWNAVIVRPKL
ncbi:MAG: hypothetical protein KC609_12345 [Myxococcales bacterium]|nr:hypothetical protein [Myxococcales bacterium]